MRRAVMLMPAILLAVFSMSFFAMPAEITGAVTASAEKEVNIITIIWLAAFMVVVVLYIMTSGNKKHTKRKPAHHYKYS